jgi:hypothetical protein
MINLNDQWHLPIKGNLYAGLNSLIRNEIKTYEEMKAKLPANMQTEMHLVMEQKDGYINNLRLLRDLSLNKCSLIHTNKIENPEEDK